MRIIIYQTDAASDTWRIQIVSGDREVCLDASERDVRTLTASLQLETHSDTNSLTIAIPYQDPVELPS